MSKTKMPQKPNLAKDMVSKPGVPKYSSKGTRTKLNKAAEKHMFGSRSSS